MKPIIILSCLIVLVACKQQLSRAEVETHLKNAMRTHLYEQINNDSTKAKYEVQRVIFYEEKDNYYCEFTVRLRQPAKDTTGIMTAEISKDFKIVKRQS